MTLRTSLSIVLLVFGASCNTCNRHSQATQNALLGRWDLVQALRNGKPTETLEGTYFEFGQDGKMFCNLPVGAENGVEYEIQDQEIRQKSTMPLTYTIRSIDHANLNLAFELRGMQFELVLARPTEVPEGSVPLDSVGHEQ